MPVYRDSAFVFDSIEQCEQTFRAESANPQSGDALIYTRYGNPTVMEVEQQIADVEGSNWAVLTGSGMSAVDIALALYHRADQTGTWLFFDEIYGGTKAYIAKVLEQRRGVRVTYFAPRAGQEAYDLAEFARVLDDVRPTLLYFEPVSNPLLIVANGKEIIRLAKERGIPVVIDNTFATPHLWRPLADGADIVLHSATKYLSGHGNITAGVVCGNDDALRQAAMAYRKFVGLILSPDDAYRLGTQLKTFDLRVAKQNKNAFKLAQLLASHEKVQQVRFPGLPTHPTHQEAQALFGGSGFGAMITFDLKGGRAACETFIAAISGHVKFLTTLGDAHSILIHVPTVFTPERFPFPGMIRFSVGFEAYDTLETAVLKALAAI